MSIQASTLFESFRESGLLQERIGADVVIERVSAAEHCSAGDLVFIDRDTFVQAALDGGASAVITDSAHATAFSESPSVAVMTTGNVSLARALVTQRFFDRDLSAEPSARIDPTAVIAESAKIGPSVLIGPGARIGEDTVILANAVIEERALIGDRVVVHPGVIVGFECEIGNDVVIRAGTVIGSEGFGFAQDEQRRSHRIPQMGKVVIEDRVVIGANCCLDRGTHGATRVGAGTVMDNLCHIAHNVEIGENCILTAMLCVAGSTKIGQRVVTSGQVGIIDHLNIADDVTLVQRAGVAHDIDAPGMYAGVPLLPIKEHMKSQAMIRRLASMRDTIKALEARIAALEPDAASE
ncbi:MAG: UDP-3-O-(3-hydroxymyristoyl)glucosamine N-acyltransferase [Planctomycetota bacterium]|jgi:UDP-3-O-[3-hydroxymyristoyl] glucosamine N-acyltransferase